MPFHYSQLKLGGVRSVGPNCNCNNSNALHFDHLVKLNGCPHLLATPIEDRPFEIKFSELFSISSLYSHCEVI